MSFKTRLRPSRGVIAGAIAFLAWTVYWAGIVVTDVLTETALGRAGSLQGLSLHEVFEVLFTAAHGGVRWAAGTGLILLAWGTTRFWRVRRRRAHELPRRREAMVTGD